MQHIQHVLPWSASGTQRTLSVFRFGSGPRKAYIQASLHADELPGMRVAVELKRRLRELEAQGRLNGVIELVPMANPIGIGQMFQATHQGRFEFNSGRISTATSRHSPMRWPNGSPANWAAMPRATWD